MTVALVAPELTVLPADGGFYMPVSCPGCGGGLVVEASSRGREDVAFPCRELRASLFCRHCKDRYVLEVKLGIATRQKAPERRWTK